MNQGNIDTLNDLFKEYRVEFQMIALIPVKLDWRLFMKNLFEHTSSPWIRYSSYEYRTAEDGTLYIVVSKDAKPEMYNPMKDAESHLYWMLSISVCRSCTKRRKMNWKVWFLVSLIPTDF